VDGHGAAACSSSCWCGPIASRLWGRHLADGLVRERGRRHPSASTGGNAENITTRTLGFQLSLRKLTRIRLFPSAKRLDLFPRPSHHQQDEDRRPSGLTGHDFPDSLIEMPARGSKLASSPNGRCDFSLDDSAANVQNHGPLGAGNRVHPGTTHTPAHAYCPPSPPRGSPRRGMSFRSPA
jgi:hypothetical protein